MMVDVEDCDCFRLWRLRTTALQMCYDRGYSVSHDELNQSLTAFKYMFGERPSRKDLTIQLANGSDPEDRIFVFFTQEARVNVNFINEVTEKLRESNAHRVILIIRQTISSHAKELISELSNKYTFEMVPEAELVGNVTDDDVMPEGMTTNEKAELLSRYKYGDFHTIDWPRDLARDRMRHKFIANQKQDFPWGLLNAVWDAGSGWICVLLVGLAAGAVWLDREHCCWSAHDTAYKDNDCSSWTTWPEMLHYYEKDYLCTFFDFISYVSWSVLMAGLAVTLVKTFAPYACGSGIPEIKCILSGFVIRGYLGKWTFLIKSVGLILASASGLSLGKEGPMVHLACCIGNIFSYIFPKYGLNEAKKREILSASAAAGVSVAFGAPIGGVMFSLEEASYYFPLKTMWRSFFCALVAGVVLRFVNPFGSDQTSLFHVDYSMKWTFMELFPFALLGIFGGVLGSLFIWANIKWSSYRKNSRMLGQNPIYEVLIVTLVTSSMAFFNPYTRKSASALIKQLFDRCGPEDYMMDLCDYNKNISDGTQIDKVDDNYHTGNFGSGVHTAFLQLVLALLAKLLFTIFTFGVKVPSGLFVPSLAMGAIAGRLLGIKVEGITYALQQSSEYSEFWSCQIGKDCVMPGLYAMVGAAAVLGGVTRMTVSLVVIMFELTGSLEFIVPTMVAVMFAKWVGDAILKLGIYDAHIELNGYPFLDNKGEYPFSTVASQVMRPGTDKSALKIINQDQMTIGELESLLRDTNYNGFPVVVGEEDMFVIGFCTRRDLHGALRNARKTHPYVTTNSKVYFSNKFPEFEPSTSAPAPLRIKKIMDMAPITVTDQTPMETVIDMFRKLGLRQGPFWCFVVHPNGTAMVDMEVSISMSIAIITAILVTCLSAVAGYFLEFKTILQLKRFNGHIQLIGDRLAERQLSDEFLSKIAALNNSSLDGLKAEREDCARLWCNFEVKSERIRAPVNVFTHASAADPDYSTLRMAPDNAFEKKEKVEDKKAQPSDEGQNKNTQEDQKLKSQFDDIGVEQVVITPKKSEDKQNKLSVKTS
uniref:Chloride channel protein n=1 Tax=Ditylenchus dipsaci TaxID=166011 RepID=A0A915EHK8_9BILA